MATAVTGLLLLAALLACAVPPSSQLDLEDGTVPACFHPVLTCKIKGKTFEFTNICGKKCRCSQPDLDICEPGCNADVKAWFAGLTSYSQYFKRCKDLRKTLMIDYE